MTANLDFFNIYLMGVLETSIQFYFLSNMLKRKPWPLFYFLFAVCAVIVNNFLPVNTVIGFVVLVLLFTVYGVVVCHADVKSSFLYAALSIEIMLLNYGVVNSLISLFYPWLPDAFYETDGIAVMLTSEAASLVFCGICYYIVYRYFSDYTKAEMQQMFVVFIPILMIFVMSEYISIIEYKFRYEVLMEDGPSGYLLNHGQMIAMYFLGLLSLFCILFSYKKLQQNFRLCTELSLLEQEEHSLNRYVEEAKARYDHTRSFRHDIKNHIIVIRELLQSGKPEEALSYIEDMDDMAEKMSFPCSTNNPVVDILLGNKLGIAKSMGIDADCSLHLPYPGGLRDIDLCIVLSNALDNAILACKHMAQGAEKCSDGSAAVPAEACVDGCPNRFIRVSGRLQGDFLLLEVANSFRGNGTYKNGTGLSNIKAVAEKYGGAMRTEAQGDVFTLRVLLIVPQNSEKVI